MWRNLKFFEDNKCGDVFFVLNEYLENLLILHKDLRKKINLQRNKLEELNQLLSSGILVPIEDLTEHNENANKLLREYQIVKFRILEVNSIMNKYLLDYKKSSLKLFKRVLSFYVEKEEYAYCQILQKVIDSLIAA